MRKKNPRTMAIDPWVRKMTPEGPEPFVLSIEVGLEKWPSFIHPFHVGYNAQVAKQRAVQIFEECREGNYPFEGSRVPQQCCTVAVMRDGQVYDCWDGLEWSSVIKQRERHANDRRLAAEHRAKERAAAIEAWEAVPQAVKDNFDEIKRRVSADITFIRTNEFGMWANKNADYLALLHRYKQATEFSN